MDIEKSMNLCNVDLTDEQWTLLYQSISILNGTSTTTPLPPHVPAEQEFNTSEHVDGGSGGYGGFSLLETTMYSAGLPNQMQPMQQPQEIPVVKLPEGLQPVGYMNGIPMYDLPAVTAPVATTSNRKRKRDDDEQDNRPYVKKPPNAFMLYMKEQRPKYVAEMKVSGTAQVNKVLGQKWNLLSDVEKSKYYDEAQRERRLHEQQHPDWSPRANYGKKRKRDRTKAARMARGQ